MTYLNVCVPVRTELLSLAGKSIGKMDKKHKNGRPSPSPLSTPHPRPWRVLLRVSSAGPCLRLALSLCLQVVAMLRKFYSHGACAQGLSFMQELVSRFRHCPKWGGRQAFACICQVSTATGSCPWQRLGFFTEVPHLRGHSTAGSYNVLSSHPVHIPHTVDTCCVLGIVEMKSVKSQPALPPDPAHSCHTSFRGRVQKPLFMPQAYNLCPLSPLQPPPHD